MDHQRSYPEAGISGWRADEQGYADPRYREPGAESHPDAARLGTGRHGGPGFGGAQGVPVDDATERYGDPPRYGTPEHPTSGPVPGYQDLAASAGPPRYDDPAEPAGYAAARGGRHASPGPALEVPLPGAAPVSRFDVPAGPADAGYPGTSWESAATEGFQAGVGTADSLAPAGREVGGGRHEAPDHGGADELPRPVSPGDPGPPPSHGHAARSAEPGDPARSADPLLTAPDRAPLEGDRDGDPPGTLAGGGSPIPGAAANTHSPLRGYPVVQPGRAADPAGPLDQPTGLVPQLDARAAVDDVPENGGAVLRPQVTPPVAAPATPAGTDGLYRSRRPALAVMLTVLTLIFEVPAVRLFLDGAVGDEVAPRALLAGTFLVLGIPAFATGLYGLMTGAAAFGDPVRAWLRPPTGYLTIGLALFVAAGLAAG
ncbi:hypothetical protein [Micromonospora sp. HM5-17]|uniref:hypothetical protein n=1 Tax=Micromonospora sp. HM5-17 TaxID=2487710 RepID=UPI000F4915F7|nr:hypothetical protein [Micromonospora sp. HM5-17]ROT32745.1 hypothetical protein EF879_05950 [Micromonospora sp. HM5-17]